MDCLVRGISQWNRSVRGYFLRAGRVANGTCDNEPILQKLRAIREQGHSCAKTRRNLSNIVDLHLLFHQRVNTETAGWSFRLYCSRRPKIQRSLTD